MSNIILHLQSSTRVSVCTFCLPSLTDLFYSQISNFKSDVHEHSPWTKRAKSRPDSAVLMPHYLRLTAPMEIRTHSSNRVLSSRYIVHPIPHFNIDFVPGRLVRLILVAVVCDKPAAHKIGGFASHSHTKFCTACWICSGHACIQGHCLLAI